MIYKILFLQNYVIIVNIALWHVTYLFVVVT